MSSKLRWGLVALGTVVVIAMLMPMYERFFGRKRLRFPYLAGPIAPAAYDALAGKPGWAKSQIEVASGIKLNGLLRRPTNKSAPWVLFYPGNDESQLDRGQSFLIRLAGSEDFGLAVFAYRGYDSSAGKAEHANIAADAPEILAKLCAAEGLKPRQVHLAGFSIGGHFVVQAAGGAAKRGQRAASLTLWAPVNDIVMYQPSRFEKLSAGEDYQTAPHLGDVPAPVLVLQGSADSALDGPEQGKAIAQALGSRATYQELAGEDHVPLLSNEEALAAMRKFVQEHAAK